MLRISLSSRASLALATLLLVACGDTQELALSRMTDTPPPAAIPAEPEVEISAYAPGRYSDLAPVEGLASAVLYQANVRHMSPAGNLAGITAQLDRLEALGVDVLSLSPVFPVGEEGRQGELGRVEAVADHTRLGAEFGSRADLSQLVEAARARGMRVLLGWPTDRAAPDHPWAARGWLDDAPGWTDPEPDTRPLDWSEPELREAVADAMRGWLELGVDGFHVSGVERTPVEFWETFRAELGEEIAPVLVADTDDLAYARAGFDALADDRMREAVQAVVRGGADARAVRDAFAARASWPSDVVRLVPTSDADQNLRRGTPNQVYGNAYPPALALSWLGGGVPTIYAGQEAGSRNRLDAIARDPIDFRDHPVGALMVRLNALRDARPALAADASAPRHIATTEPRRVLAFSRGNAGERVVVLTNFSDRRVAFAVTEEAAQGIYTDAESGAGSAVVAGETRALPEWGWQVLVEGGAGEAILEE